MKKAPFRVRMSEAEREEWHTYVEGRPGERAMHLSDWVRAAMKFCRAAEEAKRLNLSDDVPHYLGVDDDAVLRKLAKLVRDSEEK